MPTWRSCCPTGPSGPNLGPMVRTRCWRPSGPRPAVVLVVGGVVAVRVGDDDGQARDVALAGSELAPGASATATVEELGSGVAIELDVTGLPPAAPGTYYQ